MLKTSRRRVWSWLLLLPVVLGGVRVPASADGAWEERRRELRAGVTHVEMVRRSPDLVVNVARVAADAGVEVRPLLAYDRVGDQDPARSREATSAMCSRARALVCVNADFFACPTCREPFGGVVRDERVLRSFSPIHEQFSVTAAGYSLDRPVWGGALRATYTWRNGVADLGGRTETREIRLGAMNTTTASDAAVLYTPDWGETTPAVDGRHELLLRTAHAVLPGSVDVEIVHERPSGGPLPHDAAILSTGGEVTQQVQRFVDDWRSSDADDKRLVIETVIGGAVRQSVGGHPVLLRAGVRSALDPKDDKVSRRHPRTLLGWTGAGELLLVTVDGRQRGRSDGVTLPEAVELLEQLGAVEAINLDGGGSSTFVGPCATGQCVLNEPSDGSERRVPLALAVVAPEPPRPIPHFAATPRVRPKAEAPAAAAPAPPTPAPAPAPPPAPPVPETAEAPVAAVDEHVAAPPITPVPEDAPATGEAAPDPEPTVAPAAAAAPRTRDDRRAVGAGWAAVAFGSLVASVGWTATLVRRRRR